MAITLITGTPGSGKTLYAVWMMQKQLKAGRRLVVDGIRDLAIDHELVDELWIRDWFNQCRQQDLIVIDEVQRIWPPQSVSVKPGVDIDELHKHRHRGVDFIIITQHPQRVHKTIRDLVGRHLHVRRLFGLKQAMVYEWDHCHNPNSGFRDAVKTRWGYPRGVFDLYTSAEVHTKQKAVVPKALYCIPLAAAVACFFAWRGLHDIAPTKFAKKGEDASASGVAIAAKPLAVSDDSKVAVSGKWRVVGQYSVDGRGYVLLADPRGRLRSELSDGFHGDTVRVEGVVDGERVAVWSGAGSDVSKNGEVKK
ncbi:zonular occludens toxin domain-containing protein [Caballeronia sp. KNU42]